MIHGDLSGRYNNSRIGSVGGPLSCLVASERLSGRGRMQLANEEGTLMSELTVERADLGMAWSVKDSFVRYVQSMGEGRILLRDGAAVTNTRQFYFPLKGLDQADENNYVLHFGGEAHFLAHHGLMSVSIRHPKIKVAADGAYLCIEQDNETVRLASLDLPEALQEDGVTMWANVRVTLAGSGAATFADNYSAGETLAPLTMRAPMPVTTR